MSAVSESLQRTIAGVDVGGTKVRVLISDRSGRVVREGREPTERDIVRQIVRIVLDLAGPACLAVGVGVPGSVDPSTGRISKAPNVPMLDGLHLRDDLESALGVPASVDNDLIAAALAESNLTGDTGVVAVIGAGTGIGLGIVHNGAPLRGARGAAGEIAELPLIDGSELEHVVSAAGLVSAYQHGGGAPTSVEAILTAAARGEEAAALALSGYAGGIAHAVRVVRALFDPDRLVLTGGLGVAPVVIDALRQELGSDLDGAFLSEFGADSPVRGALLLGRRALRSHGSASA